MSLCINPQCQKPNNSDTTIFCQSCGSELLLDGRYRVLGELGHGGFGTTYEIIDVDSHPWVLKVLTDNHPKYVELFQQEAEVLKILNHSGIPKIDLDGYFLYFPRDKQEPLHCLVMEKIEGLNLYQYIQQRGNRPIKPKRALRWLAELSLILEQVHNQSFFHRDIKPANIMLRANGSLVLIDFGTVREIDKSYLKKQAAGEITGVVTQGYTPIEQMRGKAVLQSDFYALGGTMIYLLTTKNPSHFYNFSTHKFYWQAAAPEVSPQFVDLLDRMMAFSPSERPANCREIFHQVIAMNSSLQILDEDFNSSRPEPTSTLNINQNYLQSTFSSSKSQITPEFVRRCRQELAEFIGPMATIICDRILKQNPNISQEELCTALAKTINNPKQARDFQRRF
ncbi:MAG: serine/threonine-protein kinase [Pleurocapsa sp. MO_226.B13]|nr:serine/threonine-protein kinase [Pleurocapsa sp. MO_226.B13]